MNAKTLLNKKQFCLLMAAGAASALLTGCSGSSGSDPETSTEKSAIVDYTCFSNPLFVKLDVSKTLFFCCYISSCFDRGYLDQSKLSMTSGSDHRCAIIDSLACSRCWAVKQV